MSTFIHNRNFKIIHRELSAFFLFDGFHRAEITTNKYINLNSKNQECYEGDNYTAEEIELLGKIIKKNFNCTTPFIPYEHRNGAEICSNVTIGKQVHDFMEATSRRFSTNMWTDDYYFLPPCTYNTYTYTLKKFGQQPKKKDIYSKIYQRKGLIEHLYLIFTLFQRCM